MKRTIILLPALVLLVPAMIGCQLAEPSSEEQVDAESVAWLITDPANGLAQEVTDLGSYLFSLGSTQSAATQGSIIETKALGVTASYALYFCGNLGGFNWNRCGYLPTKPRSTPGLPVCPGAFLHLR